MRKLSKAMLVSVAWMLLAAMFSSCKKEYIDNPTLEQGGSISGVVRYCPVHEYQIATNLPLFPLDSAKVVLVDAGGKRIDSMLTNREGVVSFINLPEGHYSVLLSHRQTTNTLTLTADVSGKQTAYLQSDGFDCINFQLAETIKKKWTFIHLANNSQTSIAPGSFREARKHEKYGGSGAELNNVVFFDCGMKQSQLMYLVDPGFIPDPDPIEDIGPGLTPRVYSPAYVYSRENADFAISGDLGDYKFMQKKIKQIADLYPSDSVALFIYSHGSGIDEEPLFNQTRAISQNPLTYKEITTPQLGEMLTNLRAEGVNIGIVLTNACFMNMFEVGYELKDTGVKYFLAAETAGAGLFGADREVNFIHNFNDGVGTSYQMGVEICSNPRSAVLALCDLTKMGRMAELYNDFAKKIDQTPIKYVQPVILNTTKVERMGFESNMTFNYYDLGDFALQISKTEFVDTYQLKPAALALYNYMKDRSGYVAAMGIAQDTEWQKRMTGVSTLLVTPGNAYEEEQIPYRHTRYYKDGNTTWERFLSKIDWANPDMEEWNGSVSVPTQMTAEEVWINIPSELAWVAQQVNSGAQDFVGKKIILKKDIDLGGRKQQKWTPIGTAMKPFKGTYQGEGHKIHRLYINSGELTNVGLFGCITDAAIYSCKIENGMITVAEGTANGGANLCVGGICGTALTVSTQSIITDASVHCSIEVVANEALVNMGGLFGELKGAFVLKNCESVCSMTGETKGAKMLAAGGLIGNCGSGGMMGQVTLTTGTFLNGQLFVRSEGDASAGGIIGCNENGNLKIVQAENSSLINVRAKVYAYAGGLVGNSTKQLTIVRGNNVATLSATVATPGTYSRAYAGGMVGAASAKLYACSSSAVIVCNDLKGGLAGEFDGVVSCCNLLTRDDWAIAARVTPGQSVTAVDTYYNSILGPVGEGTIQKKNCVPFSATAWPNDNMKGWGPQAPEGVNLEDWNLPWATLGKWNNGDPIYPVMKSFVID